MIAWTGACTATLRLGMLMLLALTLSRPAAAQFTRFQNYNEDQGLGNLVVTALAQDPTGYLIVGTEGGLYRYDGVGFTNDFHGIPRDAISQVGVDDAGKVWVLTKDSGVFEGTGTDFARIAIGRPWVSGWNSRRLALLPDKVILVIGQEVIAAPTRRGRAGAFSPLFDEATLDRVPALRQPRFVVPDGSGIIMGCKEGLCEVSSGHIRISGTAEGLPADEWLTARRTADGTLWTRSLTRLAWRKRSETTFTVTTVPGRHEETYHDSAIGRDLLPDARAGLLTEGDNGLLAWTGSGWHICLPHAGGLPEAPVVALFHDRAGTLWLGSEGIGLFRDQQWGVWEHRTVQDGLPSNQIWAILRRPNGQIWVTTNHGSLTLDGTPPKSVPGGAYALATSRAGRLWLFPMTTPPIRIGTDDREQVLPGLLDGGKATVLSARTDRANGLWLATDQDVFMVPDADAPPAAEHAHAVLHAPGCLLPSYHGDLRYVVCRSGIFLRDERNRLIRLQAAKPFDSSPLDALFATDDKLWVAVTGSGILQYRIDRDRITPLPYVLPPALAGTDIVSLHMDRRGRIWFGSDHGVFLLDHDRWRHFDSSEGPVSNDLNQASIYEDVDGSMWFGTSRGLSHLLDPDHLPPPATLHPVITAVSLGSQSFPPSGPVRVGWSRKPLVVHVADLDYTKGRDVSFRYRLQGVDPGWNDTSAREMRYVGLPSGHLHFDLVAIDTAQQIVSPPIGFDIAIETPWWARWWFHALCVLVAATLLLALWQVRMRLLLRQRRQLETLVVMRTSEIAEARDLLEQQAEDLKRLALRDTLTGLSNRHAIMIALDAALLDARGGGQPVAALLLDIDHFKKINDRHGHLTGDVVLRAFGAKLSALATAPAAAGRYGGEEFLLILRGGAEQILARLAALHAAMVAEPGHIDGVEQAVTCSGGVAFLRAEDTAFSLLARADAALYRAKAAGRNRIETEQDPHLESDTSSDEALERDLRRALERDELSLVYQPIVDMRSGRTTVVEALVRWRSPVHGVVPPSRFIPIAEKSALIAVVDRWVMRTACLQAVDWPQDVRISVNLSATQLHRPGLVENVAAVLHETGLPARRLEIEVTETSIITNVTDAATALSGLRALGVSIALDDFGTGWSSLSFLRTLPLDRVKIDRSFVQELGLRPEAQAIIGSVIHFCTKMGVAATAEGVETREQLELLLAIGCHELQGYHIQHPGPAERLRFPSASLAPAQRRETLEA